jgi:hypothetical protein
MRGMLAYEPFFVWFLLNLGDLEKFFEEIFFIFIVTLLGGYE